MPQKANTLIDKEINSFMKNHDASTNFTVMIQELTGHQQASVLLLRPSLLPCPWHSSLFKFLYHNSLQQSNKGIIKFPIRSDKR